MAIEHRTTAQNADWTALLALALATLFWSGNFIAGRALRDDIDPVTLNTLRWTFAAALFLPFIAPGCRVHAAAIRQNWRYLLALGATGIAGFHTVVYVALTQTTAANALLALALVPATILVGSALIGASRPTPLQWGGSALSLAGAAVLVTRADPDVLRALAVNPGDLWMLAAIVIWSAYTLLLKNRPAALPPTVTLAASMGFGLALMLPLFLLLLPRAHLDLSADLGWALAYIVVFPSVLAFWLWAYGVVRLGPERAGQFIHLMPVFGPILAMAILGERVVAAQVAGATVVFVGLVAVVLGRQK